MKKKSIKEIDSQWMRRINAILDDKFFIEFSPSMINQLVFGSKKVRGKKRRVNLGFCSYEALIVAIREMPKSISSRKVYGYLITLANSEEFINECNKKIDSVKPLSDVTKLSDVISNFKKEK